MSADGSYAARLTHDEFDYWWPSISPDGMHIAFSSDRCGGWHFYMMDIDGQNIVTFPDQAKDAAYRAAWSLDGKRIAFTLNHDIYAMNVDGSNFVDLTNSPANNERPSWSPDGTRIVFESSRSYLAPDPDIKSSFVTQLFVMNADGSNPVQLTHIGNLALPEGSANLTEVTFPAWSPDGRYIAFSVLGPDGGLMIMSADGSNQRKLSTVIFGLISTWSPDSKYIAVPAGYGPIVDKDGKEQDTSALYAVDVDTGQSIQLTDFSDDVNYPSWGR
jgi:TolB protein